MLNKKYGIILYGIFDNTILLSMGKFNKIYHLLFKPAINYNYYAGIIHN